VGNIVKAGHNGQEKRNDNQLLTPRYCKKQRYDFAPEKKAAMASNTKNQSVQIIYSLLLKEMLL